ncbi:MAG: hypothetical protein EPN49_11625 [Rhodanobacter sp.]|nr:MAG: hypothetical protein EPN49_11625 [Rhodanobacter sp.]
MKFSPKIIAATVALGLSLAAGSVCAQEAMPAHASSSMGGMGHMDSAMKHDKMMHSKMMHRMNGSMHMMPATVTSVDTKTGMVEATSEGMSLRVHFPPKSVEHLKAGDKITLHMGYSK